MRNQIVFPSRIFPKEHFMFKILIGVGIGIYVCVKFEGFVQELKNTFTNGDSEKN